MTQGSLPKVVLGTGAIIVLAACVSVNQATATKRVGVNPRVEYRDLTAGRFEPRRSPEEIFALKLVAATIEPMTQSTDGLAPIDVIASAPLPPPATTVPVVQPIPRETVASQEVAKTPASEVDSGAAAPLLVDFDNESAVLDPSMLDVKAITAAYERGLDFFLIGQSHGHSNVGVDTLAVRRSKAIERALIARGIPRTRIHTLASWSPHAVTYAPARGVQIFMMDANSDPSRALLALQVGS